MNKARLAEAGRGLFQIEQSNTLVLDDRSVFYASIEHKTGNDYVPLS